MPNKTLLTERQLEEIRFDLKNAKPSSSLAGLFRQHCEDLLTENAALREQLAQRETQLIDVLDGFRSRNIRRIDLITALLKEGIIHADERHGQLTNE